jgi:nucleoside-diphosphate-sugar epimerase
MKALIIGGTRNLGPQIVGALLDEGYDVAVLNRGQTPGELPPSVERLRADRSRPDQLAAALGKREFDLVVDTTLYSGADAIPTVELLRDRVGRYIFLSTGQVYLVMEFAERPFLEDAYDGPLMARPPEDHPADVKNWLYGVEKREAEDVLFLAHDNSRFPFTTLRLPMINSKRDHYDRIYGYLLRFFDGGPILLPEDNLALRHVYAADVVSAIMRAAKSPQAVGRAYNISQEETLSIDEFLRLLSELTDAPLRPVRVPRAQLDAHGLLPACSPFSDAWMSELDNARSERELGMRYTPVREYLARLVEHYATQPRRDVEGYRRRELELRIASERG